MRNTFFKITTAICALLLAACTTTTTVTEDTAPGKTVSKVNLKEASEINTQLGVGYIQRQQYKAAKEKLEKAIEQNPNNVIAYKTLAYLYALLGLTDEADKKYEEALERAGQNPTKT